MFYGTMMYHMVLIKRCPFLDWTELEEYRLEFLLQ